MNPLGDRRKRQRQTQQSRRSQVLKSSYKKPGADADEKSKGPNTDEKPASAGGKSRSYTYEKPDADEKSKGPNADEKPASAGENSRGPNAAEKPASESPGVHAQVGLPAEPRLGKPKTS
jgi:hypothetical protein